MTDQTFIPHRIVNQSVLPEELQLDAEEFANAADSAAVEPDQYQHTLQVPSEAAMDSMEDEAFAQVHALESLQSVIAHTSQAKEGMSASAARAAMASLERVGVQLRLPSTEAFQSGSKGVAHYAREAVEAKEQSILSKVVEFFKQWAQNIFLWIKSIATKRGRAKKALEMTNKKIAEGCKFVVDNKNANGWQAKGILPARVASLKGVEAAASSASTSIDQLVSEMRDLLKAVSGMFKESNNSETGVWEGVASANKVAAYLNRPGASGFNMAFIGGRPWSIDVGVAKAYEGGDTLPFFEFKTDVVDVATNLNGEISNQTMKGIVKSLERGMQSSDECIRLLLKYASAINAWRAVEVKADGYGKVTARVDSGMLRSTFSLSGVIRKSVSMFDGVICEAAIDCGRGCEYATPA